MKKAERRIIVMAVAGSVLAHAAVFMLSATNKAYSVFSFGFGDMGDVEGGSFSAEGTDTGVMRVVLPGFSSPELPEAPMTSEAKPKPENPEDPRRNPYIRTTQNDEDANPPESPDFISDRNTKAASELGPRPDGTLPLPTMEGLDNELLGRELKDRDFRDGELGEDESLPTVAAVGSRPSPPTPPNSILRDPDPPKTPRESEEPNETETEPDEKDTPEVEQVDERQPSETKPDALAENDPEKAEPNPLESEPNPTPPVENLAPPSNVAELSGGEDIFPLPVRPEMVPTIPVPEPVETLPSEVATIPEPEVRKATPVPAEPAPPVTPSVASIPSNPLPGDPRAESADIFQPHTRKRSVSGTISNRGSDTVDAESTAIGKYHRQVTSEIERRWHILRRQKADYVTFGNLRVRFDVNPRGQTQNIRVISSDSNPIMTDFTLEAIMGARVSPMPQEVVNELGLANGLLEITYNVLIY